MLGVLGHVWTLPGPKQLRESGRLNSILRMGYGPRWGKFPSRHDAERFLRSSKKVSYDSATIVGVNLEYFRVVHLFDWPVIYTLRQMSIEGDVRSIVDFGGHVGAKYYAYRDMMDIDTTFKWHVVDVPAVCDEGRRRLQPGDTNLTYSDTIETLEECDVLLCSGSLQYCDEHLDRIIDRLPRRPPVIILNKVALADDMFYTLESFGPGRMPYRVITQDCLDDVRERYAYRRSLRWTIPDMGFDVPHRSGKSTVSMVGEVWVDADPGSDPPRTR